MFSFVYASSAIDLTQVLFKFPIDSDEFLGDNFIFSVSLLNLGIKIVIAGFLEVCQGTHILREAIVDHLCFFMCHLESFFQILERVGLHCEKTIRLRIALHRLKPFFHVRLTFNLGIIVKRSDLLGNTCHHLLPEILRYL